jgi:hypothetical protein
LHDAESVDQRERGLILHADDRFHANRIEEQRLAAILGMGAHQRMDAGRWQLAAAFLSEMAQRTRTIFAQINMQGLQAGDTKPTEVPTEAPPPRETQVTETQAPEAAGAPSENPNP